MNLLRSYQLLLIELMSVLLLYRNNEALAKTQLHSQLTGSSFVMTVLKCIYKPDSDLAFFSILIADAKCMCYICRDLVSIGAEMLNKEHITNIWIIRLGTNKEMLLEDLFALFALL